jgi:hypothetical protein
MSDYSVGVYTNTPSKAFGGVSVDNVRRTFGIADTVAELKPQMTPWFAFLSKVAKQPIDETVWKPLEYRPQWQRRNFSAIYQDVATAAADGVRFEVDYDKYGAVDGDASLTLDTSSTGYAPIFLIGGQVYKIGSSNYKLAVSPTITYRKASDDSASDIATASTTAGYYAVVPASDLTLITTGGTAVTSITLAKGQVVGSAFAEGGGAPDGWRDELKAVEFYQQIFKTAVPLFSGSSMATKYRGYSDEFKRVWQNHVMSHRMDIENAMLFGYGKYTSQDARYTWGIIPYLETQGGFIANFTYAGSTYDTFVSFMQNFMVPEIGNSGDKLVLASRKIIGWFSKLEGGSSFLGNTALSGDNNMMRMDIKNGVAGFAPINVTSIKTTFGNLHFVEEPLLRGHAEDVAVVVDLANVKYRPLAGNGISRDTFVTTNIQDNDIDGRKDQILTEAGLQIDLPETHALLLFS